jgi:hypothetical protein
MAEDPVAGSDVGPLFQAIMVNQFTRLRDGDRFFYLNETFSPAEQALLNQGNTLAKVIEANTGITNLQSNVFLFQASISGTVSMDAVGPSRGAGPRGAAGITVQLQDSSGDVLATTVTNAQGNYSFDQLSGSAANPVNASGVSGTGTYNVVLVLPSTLAQTSPDPQSINITRGGTNVAGVSFTVSSWLERTGPPRWSPVIVAPLDSVNSVTGETTNTAAQTTLAQTAVAPSTTTPASNPQSALSAGQSISTTSQMSDDSSDAGTSIVSDPEGTSEPTGKPAGLDPSLIDRVFANYETA